MNHIYVNSGAHFDSVSQVLHLAIGVCMDVELLSCRVGKWSFKAPVIQKDLGSFEWTDSSKIMILG